MIELDHHAIALKDITQILKDCTGTETFPYFADVKFVPYTHANDTIGQQIHIGFHGQDRVFARLSNNNQVLVSWFRDIDGDQKRFSGEDFERVRFIPPFCYIAKAKDIGAEKARHISAFAKACYIWNGVEDGDGVIGLTENTLSTLRKSIQYIQEHEAGLDETEEGDDLETIQNEFGMRKEPVSKNLVLSLRSRTSLQTSHEDDDFVPRKRSKLFVHSDDSLSTDSRARNNDDSVSGTEGRTTRVKAQNDVQGQLNQPTCPSPLPDHNKGFYDNTIDELESRPKMPIEELELKQDLVSALLDLDATQTTRDANLRSKKRQYGTEEKEIHDLEVSLNNMRRQLQKKKRSRDDRMREVAQLETELALGRKEERNLQNKMSSAELGYAMAMRRSRDEKR